MRIIRLCMMLVLVMVSIPMANAVEIDSPKATSNIVYLQRDTGVEAIQLPENVTQADKARMQKNLLLYGNRVLSESAESKNIIVCLQQNAYLLWRGWQTLLFLSFLRQGQFLLELRQWQRHFVGLQESLRSIRRYLVQARK